MPHVWIDARMPIIFAAVGGLELVSAAVAALAAGVHIEGQAGDVIVEVDLIDEVPVPELV